MPIIDITNEEKSNLYKVGKKPKEVQRISESEKCILFVDINEGGLLTMSKARWGHAVTTVANNDKCDDLEIES